MPSVLTSQKLPVETLQQMSLAKETCRKLRQQVKVLDQEKSALESLSHSLNNENKTLKKLTQSLSNTPQKGSTGKINKVYKILIFYLTSCKTSVRV